VSQELSKKENQLRAIVDNTIDAIITINDKGIIETFNNAAEKMFGYSADEAVGQNIKIMMPDTYSQKHDEYLETYLKKGEGKIIGRSRDVQGLHKQGSVFPITLGVNELWVNGQRKFCGIIQDISQRVEIEKELSHYRDSLEDLVKERTVALELSNKELESYSYSIAHDLRSPLRAITGFSQIIQEETVNKLTDTEMQYFERIVLASKRMAELIDDILELSRVTRSEVEHRRVNMSVIAQTIAAQLSAVDEVRSVEWKIVDGIEVIGDKKLIRLLLENLLGNAYKYSGNQPHSIIEFGSIDGQHGKHYFVKDNGLGFNMKYAGNLFKPFHRLHSDESFEGTGIGLATVKRIIQRHRGKIWAESKEGEGAIFYFNL